MTFAEHLDQCVERSGSLLCVGLDPDLGSVAEAERSCQATLAAALPHACAVKANIAFFEQFGSPGYAALERLRSAVPSDRVYIIDAKRGDVGHSSEAYARALFDVLGADAVTVNPLMGRDAVAPFLSRDGRGAFLLARTSNAGAVDLLDQRLESGGAVHDRIVSLGLEWDPGGAVGFVAGATEPAAVAAVRSQAGDAPILLPGIGAQGGALEQSVRAALGRRQPRLLIAVSRAIATAGDPPAAAAHWRTRIEAAREAAATA